MHNPETRMIRKSTATQACPGPESQSAHTVAQGIQSVSFSSLS